MNDFHLYWTLLSMPRPETSFHILLKQIDIVFFSLDVAIVSTSTLQPGVYGSGSGASIFRIGQNGKYRKILYTAVATLLGPF